MAVVFKARCRAKKRSSLRGVFYNSTGIRQRLNPAPARVSARRLSLNARRWRKNLAFRNPISPLLRSWYRAETLAHCCSFCGKAVQANYSPNLPKRTAAQRPALWGGRRLLFTPPSRGPMPFTDTLTTSLPRPTPAFPAPPARPDLPAKATSEPRVHQPPSRIAPGNPPGSCTSPRSIF